jgi:PAS domain S-box-containing protein
MKSNPEQLSIAIGIHECHSNTIKEYMRMARKKFQDQSPMKTRHEEKGLCPIIVSGEVDERYRALFDSSLCSVYIHDLEGNFLDANKTALRILGYTKKDLPSLSISAILDRDQVPVARKRIEDIIRAGSAKDPLLYRVRRKNGDYVWMEVVSTLIHRNGKPFAIQGMAWNVTEQIQMREALQRSEEQYRTMIETMNEGLSVVDKNGVMTLVNNRFCTMTAYSKDELLGKNVSVILDKENEKILRNQWSLRKKGIAEPYEIALTRKDGKTVDALVAPRPVFDEKGAFNGSLGIFTDISKLKQTERELLSYQERLRSLALEMSMVEERERRYITIELQDHLGRTLSYCKDKLRELRDNVSSHDLQTSLNEINGLFERTIHYAKTLTDEFSTQILYEKGLEAALKWLGNHFQELHALTFHFADDLKPKPLSDETNILLYQAVRELFMNIVRHAHAKNVAVSFERDYKNIRIQVHDDGIGFDVSKISSYGSEKEMFGLFSIYERLKYLGGHVQVESGTGEGTRFRLVAPLKSPGRK